MTTDKQIEIYQSADGETEVEVCLADETVWLNRQQLGELDKEATVAKFATVQLKVVARLNDRLSTTIWM